jgi:nitroreductase
MVTVTEALKQRISTRQFLPQALPASLVREILDVARWSPSGGNLQPWRVIAVAGQERETVIKLAQSQHADGVMDTTDGRPIYPANLWEPYRTRRFKLGEDMYALLGIPRTDRAGRLGRWAKNYEFFGAPVGLFFIIDERLGHAQWAHLGMFMLAVALAAWERGVSSCMQESWSVMRPVLKAHFALAQSDMIYCGMSLGYADPAAPVNRLRADRAAVDEFATLRGFD